MNNCIECGKIVDLKEGEEIPNVGIVSASVAEGDVCRICIAKGWSEATPQDFINDPAFTVGFISPIQPHDL